MAVLSGLMPSAKPHAKSRALACELGISGTPGFFIDDELVPGALDLMGLLGGKADVGFQWGSKEALGSIRIRTIKQRMLRPC